MSWSHPAFEELTRLFGVETGLTFPPERLAAAEKGIRRVLGRAGFHDPARYRDSILRGTDVLDDLITELTVGETYFFREPSQFQFIRREVLPEIRRRRGEWHVIRAWSAACSSGEEAYSLAIVLTEEGLAGRSRLLATDISSAALETARRATYGSWSLRGESTGSVRPHLRRKGDRYVVPEVLRSLVNFQRLNIASDICTYDAADAREMDLILCRNVLIYFDEETVAAVAQRLYASLADGGWLFTASSDPPLASRAPFETVVTDYGVFYRRGERRGVAMVKEATNSWREAAPAGPAPSRAPLAAVAWPLTPPDLPGGSPDSGHRGLAVATPATQEGRPEDVQVSARPAGLRTDGGACDLGGEEAAALHIRALANVEPIGAERGCAESTARYPLSSELHYLRAMLLITIGRDDEAVRSARRAIYLDRSLAIVHFTLGSILRRRGDIAGAYRAFRNARDLCAARPADEVVPLSDGEPCGRLAEAARAQMEALDPAPECPR